MQSYAPNLAQANGKAGLRLEIPEHLKGIFKQFEIHAGALRERHSVVKRSIKHADINDSKCMDVKLESTGWHRITAREIGEVTRLAASS